MQDRKYYRLNYEMGIADKDSIWSFDSGSDRWENESGSHTLTPTFWLYKMFEQESTSPSVLNLPEDLPIVTEVKKQEAWVEVK